MEIKIIAEAPKHSKRLLHTSFGVAFLVNNDLLFDTFGNPLILRKNLLKDHINLSELKHIVISHEHLDHTNGLWDILKENFNVEIFICPNFSYEFKEKIKKFKAKIIEVEKITKIKENIFTSGEIISEYKGKPVPEQFLIIKNDKISIVTGCAHPGIISIIRKVKENFSYPINLVLGGFHLRNKSKFQIEQIIREFNFQEVEKIAPCHCTGKNAIKMFKEHYKQNFINIKAGLEIKL